MIPLIAIGLGLGYWLLSDDDTKQNKGMNKPDNMENFARIFSTMPQEIINYIYKNFNHIYGSPFSSSMYSKPGQTWEYTPPGQIRISDHWNFYSRDKSDPYSEYKLHAITDKPVKDNTHWTIAKKNNKTGKYEVILSLPKKKVSKRKLWGFDPLENKETNIYFKKYLLKKQFIKEQKEFKKQVLNSFGVKLKKRQRLSRIIEQLKKKLPDVETKLKGRGYDRVIINDDEYKILKKIEKFVPYNHFDKVSEKRGRSYIWHNVVSPELYEFIKKIKKVLDEK